MTLDSLDTSTISFIAFWNHLDNGAGSIDPTTAESAMDTFAEESNGVDGTITFGRAGDGQSLTARVANCRVKDDGWIIVWLDTTNEIKQNTGDDIAGVYDLVNDWSEEDQNISPTQHQLAQEVKALRDALGNSGQSTFNYSDVGLYDYQNENAASVTQLDVKATGSSADQTADITPTSNTTLYRALVMGTSSATGVNINGSDFSNGVRDVLSNSQIAAGSTNQLTADNDGNNATDTHGSALIVWS